MWSGRNWIKYVGNLPNLLLKIHYDQLLIISKGKALESLNTNKKLIGIFKDDILILIISTDNQEVRKIKFQIRENLLQCLQLLRARFPVVSYGSVAKKCNITEKYSSVEDVFKSVLEDKVKLTTIKMPAEYKNFVKLCLLDPSFPQLVQQTQEFLVKEILNKDPII